MNWRQQAKCRDLPESVADRLFFPEQGPAVAGVAYCSGCPVITDCREFASTARIAYGVYGGEYAPDRRDRVGITITENPLSGLPITEGVPLQADDWVA